MLFLGFLVKTFPRHAHQCCISTGDERFLKSDTLGKAQIRTVLGVPAYKDGAKDATPRLSLGGGRGGPGRQLRRGRGRAGESDRARRPPHRHRGGVGGARGCPRGLRTARRVAGTAGPTGEGGAANKRIQHGAQGAAPVAGNSRSSCGIKLAGHSLLKGRSTNPPGKKFSLTIAKRRRIFF